MKLKVKKRPAMVAAKAKKGTKKTSEVPKINLRPTGLEPKKAVSIRLDQSVIDWFKKNHPDGYQTAINDVLVRHTELGDD